MTKKTEDRHALHPDIPFEALESHKFFKKQERREYAEAVRKCRLECGMQRQEIAARITEAAADSNGCHGRLVGLLDCLIYDLIGRDIKVDDCISLDDFCKALDTAKATGTNPMDMLEKMFMSKREDSEDE